MANEEKQALIAWLEEGVACSDEYGFNGNILKSMKIALAALTAPPVKSPKPETYHTISQVNFERDECWKAAIREAGFEVAD